MKKSLHWKKALRIALFVVLFGMTGTAKVYAQMFTEDNLNYTVNYGTETVTLKGHVNGTAAAGTLTIPTTVTHDGTTYTVTMIAREAFKDCIRLIGDLVIPNTVTTMGDGAFEGCTGFYGSLTIGDGLTAIPNFAFFRCGFHGTLTIGNSVKEIGSSAFEQCSGFTGSLIIPNSVVTIQYNAFFLDSGFNGSLTLPDSLERMDYHVFAECSGFTGELVLPNTLTEIKEGAFRRCSGFTGSLIIPDSVREIKRDAFAGCSGFTGELVLPKTLTVIGNDAFSGCSGFTGELIIPNTVNYIQSHAFDGCSGFNGNLLIPESLYEIEWGAFCNCSGLTSITVCNNIPPTNGNAFTGVDKSIPVYVPCNTASSYQIASYWDEFYNYQETFLNTIHLEVESSSPAYCSVSIEEMPNSCESNVATVKAIPADGYSFVAWKRYDYETYDYVEVSTEPVYTFNLENDTRLTAFVKKNTGVDENSVVSVFVYPNPTNGQVTIEAENLRHISIFNAIGQQVYDGQVDGDLFEYDFGQHEAGFYLIRLETAIGIVTKRVVLTK